MPMAEAHPPEECQPAPEPTSDQLAGEPATPELATEPATEPAPELTVGQAVSLRERPSYLKTADPMPMLRPPDLIGHQEVGQVVELRALGMVAVRFRRGTFLLEAARLSPA
jgi:hypothetical protein